MPIGDTLGGFIRPGYNPLLVADAPTIGTASSGGSLAISIAFTAPSDVGGGAITSYEAVATDTVTAAVFTGTAASSPVTITGLTEGQSYTTTVTAINAYGPSGISAASNSFQAAVALELWGMGNGNYGALGQGNTTSYSSPVQVGALTDWATVVSGTAGLAVKTDGTFWSWGRNHVGQLGNGNTTDTSSPVQVGALTTWATVGGNEGHSAAIKSDGTLWAWGYNNSGQLGQGNTTDTSSPVQVGALTDWLEVACGTYVTMATKTDGTIWSFGSNTYGNLGDGSITDRSSPVQIGALTTWSKITCNGKFAMALKTDGTIWGWGRNDSGGLGQGNTTDYSSPVQVGALTTWSKVRAGSDSGGSGWTMAIKTDGTLWCWGRNNYGQLGVGNKDTNSSPVQVGALTTWSKIAPVQKSSYALKTDGTLWSWADGGDGQLGHGNRTSYSSPVQVGALTTWSVLPIAASGITQLALKTVS